MTRREFLRSLAATSAVSVLAACAPPLPQPLTPENATLAPTSALTPIPTITPTPTPRTLGAFKPATYAKLPRWRGFNLLEKSTLAGNKPYSEWDLDFMVEQGFDFVRLPTDYRIWTEAPGKYTEKPLKEIDLLIAWARVRGVHVNLCLHRAPGYCVNPPKELLDLWSDGADGKEARIQFADQWQMFAARYRGIPSAELSFNLVNEPGNVSPEQHLRAISTAVAAIREQDPERLIVADSPSRGRRVPAFELAPLKIAQSNHCYLPRQMTAYKAPWVEGADRYPVPQWPLPASLNKYLYGDSKREFQAPLIIKGSFAALQLTMNVNTVSAQANLVVKADGVVMFEKLLKPGAGQGEWKESKFMPQGNTYQAIYDREYTASIPAGTQEVRIEVTKGDWLTFSEIRINQVILKPGSADWGVRQESFTLDAQGVLGADSGRMYYDKERLRAEEIEPWKALEALSIGVHVGEFGVYNKTLHDVTLALVRDKLDLFRNAGWGWALWNLRGSFGILDSDRADVKYESYKGHKLDRLMLELLKLG